MTLDEQKRAAAEAAIAYVSRGRSIGVGTGSTAAFFIEELAARPGLVAAAVASSEASAAALRAAGIAVVGLDEAPSCRCTSTAPTRSTPELRLIKGAGGALAREKVVASAAALFVCIVDETKLVERLGGAPVPLAVLPMATTLVARRVHALGGSPVTRPGYRTDDGAAILDVAGLDLSDPERLEAELDAIPGVVECGIFARRRADVVVAGTSAGVRALGRPGVTPA